MQECIDFPKLPSNAVLVPNCMGDFVTRYYDSVPVILNPKCKNERRIIGDAMAGQWEDEENRLYDLGQKSASEDAAVMRHKWRRWARGKAWSGRNEKDEK
jgi:hypothetical protein